MRVCLFNNLCGLNVSNSSKIVSNQTAKVCLNSTDSLEQSKVNLRSKSLPNVVICAQYHRGSYNTSDDVEVDKDNVDVEEIGAFENYDISEITKEKLRKMGINHLFPVQYKSFEMTMEGTDVILQARTGTGKTLSFAIPLVEKLQKMSKSSSRKPKVIVLAPTRELANQVKEVFSALSHTVRVTSVYGGVPINMQIDSIQCGVDVVVGTPGRVMDLMQRRVLDLSNVEHVILDEVDQMLDMGFAEDVGEILEDSYTQKVKPQTMLYSATVPDWVLNAARNYLDKDYKLISLIGKKNEQTAITVKQYAIQCRPLEKSSAIKDLVKLYTGKDGQAIVFCQTKKEADLLSSELVQKEAKALHGDISQSTRSTILKGFKEGNFRVLVTTDVAARGIDIPNVELVIQSQPPGNVSYYIHRVGRTGRAGKQGVSILLYARSDESQLALCEKAAKVKFERIRFPTAEQMRQVCVREAVSDILKVDEGLSKSFQEAAEILIKEKGAVSSLAAALALVSNAEAFQNRSLITCAEGFVTLMYRCEQHGRHFDVRNTVYKYMRGLNVHVQSFHDLTDGRGVVFDVKAEDVDAALNGFKEIKQDETEAMSRIDVLPSIVENHYRQYDSKPSYRQRQSGNRQPSRFNFSNDDDNDDDGFIASRFRPHPRMNQNRDFKNSYSNDRYTDRSRSFDRNRFSTSNRSSRYQNNRRNYMNDSDEEF
ncbi:Nucleolar RNA helicase 2 [Mactra antiquata]